MWRRQSSPSESLQKDGRLIGNHTATTGDCDHTDPTVSPSTTISSAARRELSPAPPSPDLRTGSATSNVHGPSLQASKIAATPRSQTPRAPSPRHWRLPPSPLGHDSTRKPPPGMMSRGGDYPTAVVEKMAAARPPRRRLRSPWSCSLPTLLTTAVSSIFLFIIVHSFITRQIDAKGCRMSYMRPAFAKLEGFDTEHTRFASKYSVYLYREGGIDEDPEVC